MLLSIGPFPKWLPFGPRPPFRSPDVSPTKVLLVYLEPFWLPRLPCSLSFQWVPSHAGLPSNELAESLAKTGAALPFTHVPWILANWPRSLQRLGIPATHLETIFLTTPSPARFLRYSRRNWPSPAVNCPDFVATVTAFLSSYQCWIKRKNSCSACGHPSSTWSNSPPFGLPRSWASPARHLWHYFHFWPLGVTRSP